MSRTLADKVDRLEDWVLEANASIALFQEAQKGVIEREKRLDALESLVSRLKGAAWVLGALFAALTSLVGLYLSRSGG